MDNNMTSATSSSNSGVEQLPYGPFIGPVMLDIAAVIGTAEVAAILECPKQQIYTLRRRKDFPQPLRVIAATPLWNSVDIQNFKTTWVRRKKSA